jgi:hypothetical protein
MRIPDRIAAAGMALALAMAAAGAHPSPQSEVLLEGRAGSVHAELTLPLAELELAFARPLVDPPAAGAAGRPGLPSDADVAAYLAAHIRPVSPDGRAWLVKVDGLDRFTFGDDAIAHHVNSHLTVVALRAAPDAPARVLGTLHFGQRSLEVRGADPRWWAGCADLFLLGMTHIAEGADHLLFLLTLLLPAALLAGDGRWGRFGGRRHLAVYLLKVVSAFTLGHSLTLALGALGAVRVPARPVEFAIAASILVSALHAWRPLFPGREGWVAAGFGLVHGLAFASAIADLRLDGARLAAGVLAFNLGIEAIQALLVAIVAPLLVLTAGNPSYRVARKIGAVLAGVMAVVWMAQRA